MSCVCSLYIQKPQGGSGLGADREKGKTKQRPEMLICHLENLRPQEATVPPLTVLSEAPTPGSHCPQDTDLGGSVAFWVL